MKAVMDKQKGRRSGLWILPLIFIITLTACGLGGQVEMEDSEDTSFSHETSEMSSQNSYVEESAVESSAPKEEEPEELVTFTVRPGCYVTDIADNLVSMGLADDTAAVLYKMETMDRTGFVYWNKAPKDAGRCFEAEGYITPGMYSWPKGTDLDGVLTILFGHMDEILPSDIEEKAEQQGYTVDEVLIMASIVEYESSFAPKNDDTVKPAVAAVVRNRVESGSALQMDVTIFYLQEALSEEEKAAYEAVYDTYLFAGLPAGPIGSPSLDSIQAVLAPANTNDFFFVYDDAGRYYFAETYEEHLVNCELAGLW